MTLQKIGSQFTTKKDPIGHWAEYAKRLPSNGRKQHFRNVDLTGDTTPNRKILAMLRTVQHWHLDPLNEEIRFTQYEDGNWKVFIIIDGCSKLLNENSQFNCPVFNQSVALIEGLPEWMECSNYRRYRIMPITVRKYFIEVRNTNELWQKMLRRILRHRALQECVRLAIQKSSQNKI